MTQVRRQVARVEHHRVQPPRRARATVALDATDSLRSMGGSQIHRRLRGAGNVGGLGFRMAARTEAVVVLQVNAVRERGCREDQNQSPCQKPDQASA